MFSVTFVDKIHGTTVEDFGSFEEAQEYWNEYADTPTCIAGSMKDILTGETIWEFSEEDE